MKKRFLLFVPLLLMLQIDFYAEQVFGSEETAGEEIIQENNESARDETGLSVKRFIEDMENVLVHGPGVSIDEEIEQIEMLAAPPSCVYLKQIMLRWQKTAGDMKNHLEGLAAGTISGTSLQMLKTFEMIRDMEKEYENERKKISESFGLMWIEE